MVDEKKKTQILSQIKKNLAQDPFVNHFLDDEKDDKIVILLNQSLTQISKDPYTLNLVFANVFLQGIKNYSNIIFFCLNLF